MEKKLTFDEAMHSYSSTWRFISFVVIGIVICSVGYIVWDIYSARKNCHEINGTYSLISLEHYCNDEPFYKYSDGEWRFNMSVDIDKIVLD